MGKNKLQWGLPEIVINEAVELIGCKVDDLFHMASQDELRIYFLADHCKTKEIYSIDQSKNWLTPRFVTGPEAPPYGSSDDPEEWGRQMQAHEIGLQRQDVSTGQLTTYGRLTDFKYLYEKQWKGCQPIVADTFSKFFDGNGPAEIQLDLDCICKWEATSIKHFVRLEPDSHVNEALYEGKLFVLKADLLKIFGDDISSLNVLVPVEAIANDDIFHAIDAQLPETTLPAPVVGEKTKERYAAWQAEAERLKRLNPSLCKLEIARRIETAPSVVADGLSRDYKTIYKHIDC